MEACSDGTFGDQNDIETFGVFNYCVSKDFKFEDIEVNGFQYCETLPVSDLLGVLDGTLDITGMKLWPGAVALSQYVADNRRLFAGRSILELGSGAGLSGIVMARVARRVVLTDQNVDVLRLLELNIAACCPADGGARCTSRKLRWGSAGLAAFKAEFDDVDLVVGVDVIYVASAMPALFETVEGMLLPVERARLLLMYDTNFAYADQVLFETATRFGYEVDFEAAYEHDGHRRKVVVFKRATRQ